MSKTHIQALVGGQYNSLNAKDNKERLKYTVAGCKDGKLYDYAGTNYGAFNEDAPDTEFITEADLNLSRITAVRLKGITERMQNFFNTYGANPVEEATVEDVEEVEEVVEEDNDELIEKFKKAIKKGKAKKARKLLDEIGENKKLAKMLKKLEAEG